MTTRVYRTFCRPVLVDDGFEVTLAPNGAIALSRVSEVSFDVILLDLNMPVMDGPTFYRALRARRDDTPVLLLSAHNALLAQRDLGAEDALAKPFDIDDLVERIRLLVSQPVASPDEGRGPVNSP